MAAKTLEAIARTLRRGPWPVDRLAAEISPLGGTVLRLSIPRGEATVALWGGQVLSWTPADRAPVLWMSPLARLDTGRAVRGGIPVCWPWFGPHPHDATQPSHGLVRTVEWSLVGGAAGEDFVEVVLEPPSPGVPGFESVRLTLVVRLDDALRLTLTTESRAGGAPFWFAEALHTYFAVGDVGAVAVHGLDGAWYLDQLTGERVRQVGAVRFEAEVDRIYAHDPAGAPDRGEPHRIEIEDASLERTIAVATNAASTVLWNPWIAKSARLGDMPPGAYRQMVCAEAANIPAPSFRLEPGARHVLRARYEVRPWR